MATAHTYYLPFREPRAGEKSHGHPVLGERAQDQAVARALRWIWQVEGNTEPTPFDGVSAWLDDQGALQVRLVKANAVSDVALPPEAAEALARRLAGTEPPEPEGASEAPGSAPGSG